MHRQPDFGVDVLRTKEVGNQQHVGVMNPEKVSLLVMEMLRSKLGVLLVYIDVGTPKPLLLDVKLSLVEGLEVVE